MLRTTEENKAKNRELERVVVFSWVIDQGNLHQWGVILQRLKLVRDEDLETL